ncbi:MAG: DUF4870 family protein [Gammaproteobacteria bacterium]
MQSPHTADSKVPDVPADDRLHGKGVAMVVYILFLGGIMMLFTAPIGVLIAHLKRGRVGPWVDSHLLFQIRTFWLGLPALAAGLLLAWNLSGYLIITAWVVWAIGRCGVGIHRLIDNRPIDEPRSLWFGGARITLSD